MKLLAPVAAAALLAAGGAAGWLLGKRAEPEATTVTTTATLSAGLPVAVERKRVAILAAAEDGDVRAVGRLLGPGFKYSFGGPVDGGAPAFWQRVERESGDRPLEILAEVLRLPYTLSRGLYVWPFAYDKTRDELTAYERQLLAPLGRAAVFVDGYYGWRAGITPDGDWLFYLAGD